VPFAGALAGPACKGEGGASGTPIIGVHVPSRAPSAGAGTVSESAAAGTGTASDGAVAGATELEGPGGGATAGVESPDRGPEACELVAAGADSYELVSWPTTTSSVPVAFKLGIGRPRPAPGRPAPGPAGALAGWLATPDPRRSPAPRPPRPPVIAQVGPAAGAPHQKPRVPEGVEGPRPGLFLLARACCVRAPLGRASA
jgi:hypothetical protein